MNALSPAIAAAYDRHPAAMRARLLALRDLIYAVAAEHPEVGALEEALKWGEPSVLTRPKTGTTIRLGAASPTVSALYVHCQSKVVERARLSGLALVFEGQRAVHLPLAAPIPEAEVRAFIALALTYQQWKRCWPA